MANVSIAAASYALRNRPGVSEATRNHILQVARQLQYTPDPRINSWMVRMREANDKRSLPIAWLNSKPCRDDWRRLKYLSPYFEGARDRAVELGYHLEEIWTREPGMTMRRVAEILAQRGIEGVIVSHPARHVRFDWSRLAAVAIDGALLQPRLNRVMSDNASNLFLALKSLNRLGYRRIGICLTEEVDSFSGYACRTTASYFQSTSHVPDRVPSLFYSGMKNPARQVQNWLQIHKPKVVVGLDSRLIEWATEAGFSVPDELGVVHLALDDDVKDWAGIHSNKREIGAKAAEQVISLLQNRSFGIPRVPADMLVRGSWRPGRTILNPPPRLNLKFQGSCLGRRPGTTVPAERELIHASLQPELQ